MQELSEILSPELNPDDLVAVSPDWRRADFNRAVFYLSGRLKAAGVRTVALWFEDAAWFACALLAAWHAGARVLLPPNLAAENRAWAAREAEWWLTDTAAEKVFSDGLTVKAVDWLAEMPSEYEVAQNDWRLPETAEVCLKTSGSSGTAQVVEKTLAQMQAEAAAVGALLPFAAEKAVVAGSVSQQHLYGLTFRFAVPLTLGWPVFRNQQAYPETLMAAGAGYERVVWIASPALLNRLGAARNWQPVRGRLAGIVSAGGALPQATADLLADCAVRPFEIYGSTETGVIASRGHSAEWQPLPQVAVGQDSRGALWAESPWSGGRQQTADVVEQRPSGFALLGRADRLIKFEDKRVSLVQIEHELLAHAWVADVHCGEHPQHRHLAAWTALSADGVEALREQGRAAVVAVLKQHVAASQDAVAVPRYWRFAAALPRNAQSKIAAADFQTALMQGITQPDWQQAEHPEGFAYQGHVPLDLVYFGGHFAKFPLVPGVVELQWVRDLAARFEWGRQNVVRVENLKYQQFLRPNDSVSAYLKYDAVKNKLVFKLENQDAVCASGRIVFGSFRKEAV